MQNFIKELAKDFISELKNHKPTYHSAERYDYYGCTDFLPYCMDLGDNNERKIYSLLKYTSAMELFEKYLSFGLYKVYAPEGKFNINNFGEFVDFCRTKGMFVLYTGDRPEGCQKKQEAIEFFKPYAEFMFEFVKEISDSVEEYVRGNGFSLRIATSKSIEKEQLLDGFRPITRSSSCPAL